MPALHQTILSLTYASIQIHWLHRKISIIALHGINGTLLKVKATYMPLLISSRARVSRVKYALTGVAES